MFFQSSISVTPFSTDLYSGVQQICSYPNRLAVQPAIPGRNNTMRVLHRLVALVARLGGHGDEREGQGENPQDQPDRVQTREEWECFAPQDSSGH